MAYLPSTSLRVAGRVVTAGEGHAVLDKWTGEPLTSIGLADEGTAADAARAAADAASRGRFTPAHVRRAWLQRIARGVDAERDELAELIAREGGKPLRFARAEVARAVATFELGAEESTRLTGEVLPLDGTPAGENAVGYVRRVARGAVLAVAPFNFPLNLVAHKVAPALACGAPVVVKPAPQAPLAALALGQIAREAGVPDEMLQVIPCSNAVAETLVRSDAFAVLSFTGSDRVGWHLASIAGKKRVLLELGGNAAVIVADDAARSDALHDALDRIVLGAFAHAGQVCIKVQRLFVPAGRAEAVGAALVERARAMLPASPLEETTVVGPMIDEAAARRVESWVAEAVGAGARPLLPLRRDGSRLTPCILQVEGAGRGLKVVDDEVFGPVLTVHAYERFDDAVAWANGTRFGLQAGLFTDSQAAIERAFRGLDVGALIVGDVPTFRVDSMPYGGVRDSGLGREGVRYALQEMTEPRLLVQRHGASG